MINFKQLGCFVAMVLLLVGTLMAADTDKKQIDGVIRAKVVASQGRSGNDCLLILFVKKGEQVTVRTLSYACDDGLTIQTDVPKGNLGWLRSEEGLDYGFAHQPVLHVTSLDDVQ